MSNHRQQINDAYKKKVIDKIGKVVRATALIAHGDLIEQTPVDTGRAKANWFLDIDRVDVKIVEPEFDNVGEAASRSQKYTLDSTIFISNNLPYIRRLNEGHSQQAPAGYVDRTLTIAKRKAKEFARTL